MDPQQIKTILWIGTSIPAGAPWQIVQIDGKEVGNAYPNMVGVLLERNVINKCIGASRLAAGRQSLVTEDNPLGLVGGAETLLAFWHTIEEKQDIIDNYSAYWKKYGWSGDSSITSYGNASHFLNCSYENLIVPYLDGTYTIPDVIVIDHGFNDFYYNSIDLGDLDDRSNRSTFYGAFNMLVDLIRKYNSNILIVQISHNTNIQALIEAQKAISKKNGIPFCPLYEIDGWDIDHECPDGVHPHSDTSGQQNRELAYAIAGWFKQTFGL